jgi:hypothetical protein
MAYHARKQIRDYVVNGLKGLTTTGDRVYPGRTRPLAAGHPPTLLVYLRSETSERAVRGRPPSLDRGCTLHIEGRTATADAPDDLLDQIAAEVEAKIASLIDYNTSTFFGGLVLNVDLNATEMVVEADDKNHIGGIQLQYRVIYRTVEGAPTATV